MSNSFSLPRSVGEFLARSHSQLVDGAWVESTGYGRIDVLDPGTEQILTTVARGTSEDVERAVRAADAALRRPVWREMNPTAREAMLHRFADVVEAHADELALLESLDVGMPLAAARHFAVENVVATMRYMAGWPTKVAGRSFDVAPPGSLERMLAFTVREPVGVVAAIIPWNTPLMIATWKITPALAAGCTVVLKPSEVAPLTSLRLGELALEAGLPPGVLNIVTGFGTEVGDQLVRHPCVKKISFTGSSRVGKEIQKVAADPLKKVTLEMGGKSPVILLDDADLDRALPQIAQGVFANSGQTCVAGSRLYVCKDILEEVVAKLTSIVQSQRLGHGLDPEVTLGPLVSREQQEKVQSYIENARTECAHVIEGPGRAGPGYFVPPTVLVGVHQTSPAAREEIFGPVLAVIPFEREDEVLPLANDSEYGLSSYVWGKDITRILNLVRGLEAGNVFVNASPFPDPKLPFGGIKQSGIGKEMGQETVEQYLETKSVVIGA